jgi:2-iminobutanoate/2-iminopropanoate deaminase
MANIKTFNHNLWDHGITQGYSVNGNIYISGQFSHDKEGLFIGKDDIESQTRQTLKNLDRVLEGFGVTKSNLAYVEIYLKNPKEHSESVINVFKEYLKKHRPAGSLLGIPGAAY